MLTAVDYDGTYTFTYDDVGRVATSKDIWGKTLTFTYDAASRRTKVEDSGSGVQTSTYDDAGRLTRREFGGSGQTPLRIDLSYKATGDLETIVRFSDLAGTTTVAYSTFSYDDAARLTNLHHRKGSNDASIANYTYTFDAASRLLTEVLNGTTKTYTHDTTDQLTADGTNTFTYDGVGNRTNGAYTTGTGNRLTNDGTWTFTYDDEGNLIKKSKGASQETWTYGYDQKNQMLAASKRATDGGDLQLRADYVYDAFGNRIEKRVDSNGDGNVDTTQRYAYDGWKRGPQQSLLATRTGTSGPTSTVPAASRRGISAAT